MSPFWRNRRFMSSAGKELGCGLLTMLAFTAPLWAFTMATRGPRYAFGLLVAAVLVLAVVVVISRALRKR
jgi:hypothetical protein